MIIGYVIRRCDKSTFNLYILFGLVTSLCVILVALQLPLLHILNFRFDQLHCDFMGIPPLSGVPCNHRYESWLRTFCFGIFRGVSYYGQVFSIGCCHHFSFHLSCWGWSVSAVFLFFTYDELANADGRLIIATCLQLCKNNSSTERRLLLTF